MPKKEQSYSSPVDVLEVLQTLEKVVKIQSITLSTEDRMSTGLLCLDLMLGGGITAGMYTFAGPEQSAKTTTAITAMAASVSQDVGLRVLWDAENSSGSSMDYVSNIFETTGNKFEAETLFGTKKDGKYVTKPLVYYRDEGEMETFFQWLGALLRRLPDKRFEDGRWWYVYENDRELKAKYKGVMDLKMSRANDAVYIPAESGSLQAFILVDSYPSLMPKSVDEDEAKAGMALQARKFSELLPRVKGKLRSKRVALVGINQLREKPGVMYGDPTYEPGGQSLRFMSDVRLRNTPRALSGVPFNPKGKGQYEEETSVEFDGGKDTYRYIHTKAVKNKLSVPNRESWLRIWVQDGNMQARGFDPVWDTFYCLHLTGQLSGKRSAIKLNLHKIGEAKKTVTWDEFKLLVLGTKEDMINICKKIGYKPMNIRKGMFTLMRKGVLEELYAEQAISKSKAKGADDEEEDDEEED